jgi:hypothetical protein
MVDFNFIILTVKPSLFIFSLTTNGTSHFGTSVTSALNNCGVKNVSEKKAIALTICLALSEIYTLQVSSLCSSYAICEETCTYLMQSSFPICAYSQDILSIPYILFISS